MLSLMIKNKMTLLLYLVTNMGNNIKMCK